MKKWKVFVPVALIVIAVVVVIIYRDTLEHMCKMYKFMKIVDVRNLTEEEKTLGAQVIVETCMRVKPGEKVLLIVQNDEKRRMIAKYDEAEVRRLGALPTVMYCEDEELTAEPPQRVIDEMMKSDVILAILKLDEIQIFAHSKARNDATDNGARIGLAPLLIPRITPDDVLKIRERTDKVADLMENSKIARITSADGTDLTMHIEGRKCERLRASMWEKGEWGAVPLYAEAALAPIEGSTNGKYVINGFFEGVGRVTKPFTWVIKDGRIVEVVGDGPQAEKCREILAAADDNGTNVAELGVATNHIIERIGLVGFSGTIIDKMILGTVHVACGKNLTFDGGTVFSNILHDVVSSGVTLELDGVKIIDNGKWLFD